ncbi:hypothetical protein M7I_1999 [Glarea lozoyensis 74030]|uniref:Uncharacterized protein n=1 Tax=Glarea lozoyensis (strain ATCC 74030 / MF5533) TaxID=1104152 RepID=H0EHL6_GLAL7|nr:hypothetical protein M7I_1999 [Glarea lozoyensis 74030]
MQFPILTLLTLAIAGTSLAAPIPRASQGATPSPRANTRSPMQEAPYVPVVKRDESVNMFGNVAKRAVA